jgi:LysM repeat protein
MKKEVQALIKHRRARFVPAILAGMAGLTLVAGLLLVINFFTRGPGQALLHTPTPTPTLTFTPAPPSLTPSDTLTPAPPTSTPGPSLTPTPVTYTVNSGDTLFGIAQQYSVDLCELMVFNQITDPALVSIGTVITIPVGVDAGRRRSPRLEPAGAHPVYRAVRRQLQSIAASSTARRKTSRATQQDHRP